MVVHSINKNRAIYQKQASAGRSALAGVWLDENRILNGFSDGNIEIRDTSSAPSRAPVILPQVTHHDIFQMRLEVFARADQHILVAEVSSADKIDLYVYHGQNFQNQIKLSDRLQTSDPLFLGTFGLFMLHEKYHTLQSLKFSTDQEFLGLMTTQATQG